MDIGQARTHLKALGYGEQDTVHLRRLSDRGGASLEMPVNSLDRLKQAPGEGLYFVVNPGGHKDSDIQECRCLFCEWDDRTVEWQQNAYKEFGLPKPTIQVSTGGKSIHSYWVLSKPITTEQWRGLQADLLAFLGADKSLKNPSRVMRLAGSVHQKKGQQAQIIHQSDAVYSYQELRAIIPRLPAKTTPTLAPIKPAISTPAFDGNDALYRCLAKEHRGLIDSGVPEGRRNHAAYRVATDLIGTAVWLISRAIHVDPRRYFDQFCDRCQPPLSDRERDAVWRSASQSNPSPCLSDDKLEACLQAMQSGAGTASVGKSKPMVKTEPPPEPVERAAVDAILTQQAQGFDIGQLFPERLAAAFTAKARSLNLPSVIFAGAFLPVVAGLIPQRLQLAPDFAIPSVLWCGLVGESGTAKSAVISTLKNPLDALQSAGYDAYKNRKLEWQACSKNKGDTPDPPPVRNYYYVQDSTTEALAIALEGRPSVSVISDELTGFVKGLDQYKSGGRGNDRQKWLTLYDGGALDVLRKSEQLHIKRAAVSLIGGIQPQVLSQIIQGDSDLSDGFWSRFYWLNLPMTRLPLTGEFESVSIAPMLQALYRTLADNDDSQLYKLSAGALRELNAWEAECETAKFKEPSPFLRALLPKARQRAARIALILHCVTAAFEAARPGDYVQPDTMAAAVNFTRWLLGQARRVFADCGYSDSPEALRVAKFLTRFAGMEVTPRMVRNWWSGTKKPSAQCTRDFMQKIVSLGYATVTRGTADDPDFTIQIWTNGLADGLNLSPPGNTDDDGISPTYGLMDYETIEKGKTGDGLEKSNFFSPLVHTYLEVPSNGALQDGLKVSPCLVHQSIPPDPPQSPPTQYNGITHDCKLEVPEYFLGIRQEPWRLDKNRRPEGVGWYWLTHTDHPLGGFWFQGRVA